MEAEIKEKKIGRPSKNDEKRRIILEKAKQFFVKHGYDKTNLDEISDAIGFNKAALYYYFKSKEELFISTLQFDMSKDIAKLKKELNEITQGKDKIFHYLNSKSNLYLTTLVKQGTNTQNMATIFRLTTEIRSAFLKTDIMYIANIIKNEVNTKLSIEDSMRYATMLFDIVKCKNVFGYLIHEVQLDEESLNKHRTEREFILRSILKAIECQN